MKVNQENFPHCIGCFKFLFLKFLYLCASFWAAGTYLTSCESPPTDFSHEIAIEGGTILTADTLAPIVSDGLILVRDGEIVYVGPRAEATSYHAAQRIDGEGKLICPGWINTHTHAAMTLFRGLADDLPLATWLQDHIWPAETAVLRPTTVRIGARLAILEMLASGTTTFNDMYFFEEEVAQAAADLGIRALVGEGILMFPSPSASTTSEGMNLANQLFDKWQNHPLVIPTVAPHSPYTLSETQLRACDSMARQRGALLHIHLAETREEVAQSLQTHRLSPVARLQQMGLLRKGVIAAHAVHLSASDISQMAASQIAVAHCPESNLKLGSGVAPIPVCYLAGIPVGVGTDGAASNNNLNMLGELHTAAKLHKGVQENPALLSARDWFLIGTIGGAEALGIHGITGSITVGKCADILVYDLSAPHAMPMYDPFSLLMYSLQPSDLSSVLVQGKLVWQEGQLLTGDQNRILAEARELTDQIKKDLFHQQMSPKE